MGLYSCRIVIAAMVLAATGAAPAAAGVAKHYVVDQLQPKTRQALLKFEDRLFQADVDRDIVAIDHGFAPDAIFVHANGLVQTKADYIAAIKAGKFPPSRVVGSDRDVRIAGDIGIVRGTKSLVVGDLHLSGTYLTAYEWHGGHWRMLWSQSSPQAKPEGVPSR